MSPGSSTFADVAVLAPVGGLLVYELPEELREGSEIGRRVVVPLGRRRAIGFLARIHGERPPPGVTPKPVGALLDEGPFFPGALFRTLLWASQYYLYPPGEVLRAALPPGASAVPRAKKRKARARGPEAAGEPLVVPAPTRELTVEQREAARPILAAIDRGGFAPFLLHGVTGSGKTELYLAAIERALERGRGAAVLVPEIALTNQLVARFQERFPSALAVIHSGLGRADRGRAWERLRSGRARVAVGVRSAVFAPIPELGLLAVDEEHDPSFKQDDRFCYNARDLAVARAKEEGCAVVLGSATPSLESHANAESGRYARVTLPNRIDGRRLPPVELVGLRPPMAGVATGLLQERLREALSETLERGEQAILFLNRRGHAGSLCCQSCGFVEECRNCSVSLTVHRTGRRLSCHYCGFWKPVPEFCSLCRGPLSELGAGTERVEEEVGRLFPGVRVGRADSDVGSAAKISATLAAFARRELDVLVGTQLVAKGHDFPNVTLVGVVLADLGLHLPDFRAAERTFQILVQVAGRAGRGSAGGRVIVQTYHPDHPTLLQASNHDYAAFVASERSRRRALGWPPDGRLCAVRVDASQPAAAERAARLLGSAAERLLRSGRVRGALLGPALAPLERLRGKTRWQLLLRAAGPGELRKLALELQRAALDVHGARVVFDVDPLAML